MILYARERDVKREIKRRLAESGWFVTDTSQHKTTGGGMRGLPDLICIRRNHVVFLEVKQQGGDVTNSERDWFASVAGHCGNNVYHRFVYHPDQVPRWMVE